MNRYRIKPGLGPSKALPTTTCQKCLQRGHYSYECQASLQSRPYVSRASRSQQLRNPKLKPSLNETKLADIGSNLSDEPGSVQDKSLKLGVDAEDLPQPHNATSQSPERSSKKRRRSASISSVSSVSTISTSVSDSDAEGLEPRKHTTRRRRSPSPKPKSPVLSQSRRSSLTASTSPPPVRHNTNSNSNSRRRRHRSRSVNANRVGDEGDLRVPSTSHDRERYAQRSQGPRRPDRRPEQGEVSQPLRERGDRRERSLSPYSRRLALTQAMNADR